MRIQWWRLFVWPLSILGISAFIMQLPAAWASPPNETLIYSSIIAGIMAALYEIIAQQKHHKIRIEVSLFVALVTFSIVLFSLSSF